MPPSTRWASRSPGVGRRRSSDSEQAQVPELLAQQVDGALAVARRVQHLDELLGDELGELARERAVDRDDAAERRRRVGGQRLAVGLLGRRREGAAARVAVLDDHAGRHRELLHEPRRGVEVEQVVERELLAAVLRHHREQVAASAGLHVVGGALVRVLAVGEIGDLDELAEHGARGTTRVSENQLAIAMS